MRKIVYALAVLLLITDSVIYAMTFGINPGPDDIVGVWLNPDGTKKMQIYREQEHYTGKIIWLSQPSDKVKVNDVVLKNLVYNDSRWKGELNSGGKTYKVTLTLKDGSTLSITASMGFISKTKEWKRVDK